MIHQSKEDTIMFFILEKYEVVGKVQKSQIKLSINIDLCGKKCATNENCQGFVFTQPITCFLYTEICAIKRSLKSTTYIKDQEAIADVTKCPDDDVSFARTISKYYLCYMNFN